MFHCDSGSAQVCTAKKVLANADIEIGLELILKETFEYLYYYLQSRLFFQPEFRSEILKNSETACFSSKILTLKEFQSQLISLVPILQGIPIGVLRPVQNKYKIRRASGHEDTRTGPRQVLVATLTLFQQGWQINFQNTLVSQGQYSMNQSSMNYPKCYFLSQFWLNFN